VLERLTPVAPKVCSLLEGAEEDLTAFYLLPSEHWTKLRSTNPLERVNKEIGRRSDVVGIFPNDQAAIRLAGALLSEQNDEWLVQRRYLSAESMTLILDATSGPEDSLEQQHHLKETAALNTDLRRQPPADELGALHHTNRLD
jgi:putative transposase